MNEMLNSNGFQLNQNQFFVSSILTESNSVKNGMEE